MKQLADLTAPAAVERKLLEKDVQSQCVDWARDRGYWARKISSMTQRSIPDYQFAKRIKDVRCKFTVEFKAPGKKSTAAQEDEQQAMIAAGWLFFECDNFGKFKYEVDRIERTCCTMEL